jgi:membrane peptidoglycan carboxypeptidase
MGRPVRATGSRGGGGAGHGGSGGGRGRGRRRAADNGKPRWRKILSFKTFLFTGLGLFLLGAIGIGVAYAMTPIPDPNEVTGYQASIIYWSDGETELYKYTDYDREPVTLDQVPLRVQQAVLAAEDRTFYEHGGFDPIGIARAAVNQLQGGVGGGSTITQQFVKNYYLSPEQTLTRKVKELFISVKIDQRMSKEQVLESYLNTVFWGRGNVLGIQSASKAYFGKPVDELTLEEGAALAAMIQSPNRHDPTLGEQNAENFESRWRWVLDGMVQMGAIDQATADAAQVPEFLPQKSGNALGGPNGYLVDMVEKELADAGLTEQQIKTGGLRIVTTFDKDKQQAAIDAVEQEFPRGEDGEFWKDLHMGLAAVRPGTGEVVAAYGGHDYVERAGVNDALSALQPGSTMKPFGVIAALEDGLSLESRFQGDSPIEDERLGEDDSVENQGDRDYGEVDLVRATERSINTAFIDMTLQIGYEKMQDAMVRAGIPAESLGIDSDQPNPEYRSLIGISLASPVEMANAYATLAAQGRRAEAHSVKRVTAPTGAVLYEPESEPEQVFDEDVVSDVTYALTQVVEAEDGTGYAARDLGRPAAGKTGTHEEVTSWFAGYTPQLAGTVMFYHDTGGSETSLRGIVEGEPDEPFPGGKVPARIWTAFMKTALADEEVLPFPPPANVGEPVNPTPTPTVEPTCPPGMVGDPTSDEGCQPEPTVQPTCPPGTEGTPPDCKRQEPDQVEVPNVVGMSQEQALRELRGFDVDVQHQTSDAPQGQVIAQNPAGGSTAPRGSAVTIVVATPETQVQVPNVVGQREDQAVSALQERGLVPNIVYVDANPPDDGRVLSQNPSGGSTVEPGTSVTIEVGRQSSGGG